ncbi:MAG: hypothetical protein AB7I09_20325 [Planctomycetota bacterium]
MSVAEQRLWSLEPTEDTTSFGSSTLRLTPRGSTAPRNRLSRFDDQRVIVDLVSAWGSMLGTREEQAALLLQFEDFSTDATSWEIYEGSEDGLQGVVAVQRRRPELFRMTVDIRPGSLPRREPSFAFLEHPGTDDAE